MNKSLARVLGILVCVMMCVAAFAGCKSAAPATSAPTVDETVAPVATEAPFDTSALIELDCYMVGDGPRDLQMVVDKVNEITKADLNLTVKWNFTTWTDMGTKYGLLLSSGQPVDLIYTATWINFWTYARQNAFNPLEELLPKYAPELNAHEGPQALMQATVNGHLMTVPCTYKEYITNGITYRKDLSTITPDSLENIEAYLLDVKAKHPEQTELTLEGAITGTCPSASFSAMETLALKYKWVNTKMSDGIAYGLYANYDTPSDIQPYWGTADFIADMKMFKRWADEGIWSQSALSQPSDSNAFDNGRIVMMMSGENPMKYSQHLLKAANDHPDWEIGYYNFAFASQNAIPAHPCQNGYAEPAACPNPERALMYLEKLIMDKTVNQLQEYGIEGVHYTVENGYYKALGDATNSGFGREGMNGWGYRNEDYMLYAPSFDSVKALNEQLAPYTKMNIMDGFAENYTDYDAQRTALGSVLLEKLAPLQGGLAGDVDAAVAAFMSAANDAGLADIQAAYTTQWKAYVESLALS